MNWLDIAIVIVIAFFIGTAFMAGLIREVVTLVSAVVGVVVAGLFYDDLARDVLAFIEDEKAARVVSFLVLFGAIYLAGQLIAVMLKQVAAILFLGWADRAGGALFGFLKGLVVVEVLLILLVTYPHLGLEDAIDGSAIGSVMLKDWPDALAWLYPPSWFGYDPPALVDVVLVILPDEFEQAVDAFLA